MSTAANNQTTGWTNAATMDWGVERYVAEGCSAGKVMYQTIEGLPAGVYTVKFYAFARIARDNTLPTADTQSTIAYGYAQAGSNEAVTQALTIPTEYTDGHAGFTDDDMVTLTVTLGEGESLEYGIQNAAAGGQWYGVSAISLVSDATPEAKSYSEEDVVEEEEAEGDHWKIVGSEGGSLVNQLKLNTWSTEADASGMVTPFVQYWRGAGNELSASTINHYQLGGLPKGLYTISIFARAFNEGSLTDIATGTIFFTANDESVDITTGTHGSYGGSADDYGTFNLVAEVDEAGTLDIGFSISANSNCDWLAWKNLTVVYDGESLPDLEYVTGDMNAEVEATMKAAVDKYNGSKDADDYTAALAAIATAEESVAQYAEIAALVGALDTDGAAVWAETTRGISYSDKTLTINDDWSSDMASAQKAQTTEGSDMSYVIRYTGYWTGATATITADGSTVQEDYQTTQYTGTTDSPTRILYKTLEGLQAGTYSVSFYAEANATKDRGFDTNSGSNIAQVFANSKVKDITVNEYTVLGNGDSHSWLDADLYTLQCTVKANGILDFGLQNVGTGGNWYTAMASSLSLVELNCTIDEATASATSVYQGQKVTIQFSYADPTNKYELTGTDFTTYDGIEVSYAGGGAFTFTVPTDATDALSITIPAGVLAYTDANVQNEAQTLEFIVKEAIIAYGDYLIVDADGYYLGGGLIWGTQAAIIGKPQFIGFEVQGDGTYHLDSHQYNDENSHYLGDNLYFDNGTPVDWTIEEVDGGYTISCAVEAYDEEGNFTNRTTCYLTSNGFQKEASVVEETPYVWSLVTMDDVIASMSKATSYVPVDVTALIKAPELKRNSNTSYYPTWTVSGFDGTGTPSNYAFGGGSAVASCAESYHSENGFNINQEITLPLAGNYMLSAKGFYRNDGSETLLLPVLYAGDLTSTFPELDTSANNMAEAYAEFLEGLHPIDAITITTDDDNETVTIGFKGEDTSLWNIFGELELLYYGTENPVLPDGTVHECEAPLLDNAAEDYDSSDIWTISGNSNGLFQRNTWSTEADPSGLVTPYIEYWVGSGSQLSDATISHTQLTDLTAGYYEVSIFARAFNENNLVDVSEGITFNANNESIDLNKETHATYNHVSAEEYGTYKVYCEVGTEGTLDINFTLQNVNCDWLAFKNLKVVHLGFSLSDLPKLSAAEGTMNSSIESAQSEALEAYASEATLDNYNTAYQAVECARVSVAFYAGIADALAQLDAYLDDSGKAWLEENEAIESYRNNTLTYQDMYDVYWGAVKQQTTAGTVLTDAMEATGEWTADQGNGPNGYSTFATETFIDGQASEGTVLTYTVKGLSAGTYEVSFYVAANMANEVVGNSGDGITEAFANDATEGITVGTNSAGNITSLDNMNLVTLICTVGEDGILTFGLQNVATGGNWFLCAPLSLTLVSLTDIEAGDEVHSCTAELSHWTQTFTGSGNYGEYALNTWSVEEDASGMVTPFLQTWVYGEFLSDQTIDHNQLSGLPQGWYSVTVDARIMSETGEAITGTATLTANNDFIYIISDGTDGTYGTETEEYGTYTVQCYVGEDGTLDIGFTIADANFNWFAWKNLRVVYLGETVEYNVGEATASATIVMPGQTVTLTFADCTKGDEEATLEASGSANVTFGETSVTLTPKGTITFIFDVPEVAESGEYTLTIPENTIVWTLGDETKACNVAQTITFTVLVPATIGNGDYLIVNADGYYLGGGLTWGTQAAIIGKPQFIGFEVQENGTYHLDSHQYNNEDSHYLGTNLYFDSSAADWTLVEVEGGYAIYGTADTGTGYLTSNGFQTVATVEATPYIWTLVTMDNIVASMADATKDAPVDVTALIKSPELKRNSNTEWYPTWTCTGYSDTENEPNNYSFGGGIAVANCAESNNSTNGFDVNQIITLPLAGTYKLSAQGFHDGDATDIVLYAGDDTAALPYATDVESQEAAYQAFLEGTYPVGPITITTTSDEQKVTIGFKGNNSSEWVVMGELDLQYLGVVEETVVEWTMTDANWGTLILPFDADIPTATDDGTDATLTVYTCDKLESDGTTLTLVEAETIEACTPYILSGTAGTYTFSGVAINTEDRYTVGLLTGTLVDMSQENNDFTVDSGQYVLQNHEDGGLAFYQITNQSTNVTLNAYHCFLTYTGAEPAALRIPGKATGIVAVEGGVIANGAIYDLAGRKVSKAVKGIYIQNGKKVLVK